MIIDRDSHKARLAGLLDGFDRLLPRGIARPIVIPNVELIDVHMLAAEIVNRLIKRGQHIVLREDVLELGAWLRRPNAVLRRDFAGDDDLRIISEGLGDQLLAMPLTI